MNTLEIQRDLIEEIEECYGNINTKAQKLKFLCNLIGIPICSVIGDDDKLLSELTNWLNN